MTVVACSPWQESPASRLPSPGRTQHHQPPHTQSTPPSPTQSPLPAFTRTCVAPTSHLLTSGVQTSRAATCRAPTLWRLWLSKPTLRCVCAVPFWGGGSIRAQFWACYTGICGAHLTRNVVVHMV